MSPETKKCPSCGALGYDPEDVHRPCPNGCTRAEIRKAISLGKGFDDETPYPTEKTLHDLIGNYSAIPHKVVHSKEYAALSANEVKLLVDLLGQLNGRNNGALNASFKLLRKYGWHSSATLAKTLEGLQEKGFIVRTRKGGQGRGCALWGLTWLPLGTGKEVRILKRVRRNWKIDVWKSA